jgi:hypothetical protein
MRNGLLSTTAATGLAASFGLLAAPAGANAGTQVLAPITITTTGADFFSSPLTIPTFDSSKGHLQSVMVFEKLTANYRGTASLSSSGNGSTTYSGALRVKTALNISGKPGSITGSPVFSVAGSTSITVAPGSSTPYTSTGNTASNGPFKFTTGLSDWESAGPGSVTALVSSTTALNNSPPVGGLSITPNPDLTLVLDVTYTYSTPEPASALMVGAGLIALGAARRRRKTPSKPA